MLGYATLFCILPYMEANQRILLTARCSSLSTVDQNTLFRLKRVSFEHHKITLNKISYGVIKREAEIPGPNPEDVQNFGDIELNGFREARSHRRKVLEVIFQRGTTSDRKRIPEHYRGFPVAVRRLIDVLLGGREHVLVDYLEFNFGRDPSLMRMPLGLKFHVRNLDAGVHDFRSFVSLLTESSYPLNGLKITGFCRAKLSHSVLQEARTLVIWRPDFHLENRLAHFQRLPNKRITISGDGILVDEMLEIVKYWVNNRKEIGTRLWVSWDQARMEKFVEMAKERFNGSYVELVQRDERQLPSSKCVSIPITFDSELIIYGSAEKQPDDIYYNAYETAVLKVVPVGSTKPVEALVPEPKVIVPLQELRIQVEQNNQVPEPAVGVAMEDPRLRVEQNNQEGKSRKSKMFLFSYSFLFSY